MQQQESENFQETNLSKISYPLLVKMFDPDILLDDGKTLNNEWNLIHKINENFSQDGLSPDRTDNQIPSEKVFNSHERKNKRKIKEFRCSNEGCNKIYKTRENLKLHVMNIHQKCKPYKCLFCEAFFSHRNGKIYHERKFHTNILPYKCNFEGKPFI